MEEAERPRERGWEGHSLPCLSVGTIGSGETRREPGGWGMTPGGTPKPQLQKERHQALAEGEPPSAPQKRGQQRGRKEQSGGHTEG